MKELETIQNDQMAEMRFLVKSTTKMAIVNPWRPPVSHIKYLKLVDEVSENLS